MKITERLMAKKLYGQKKSVVEALDIKPTNYGYWITSNGEFIPVSSAFGHGATVSEYFPTSPTKREAMENGWIKVTHTTGYDSIAIQYHYQNVSKQAISNLVAFIREDMKEGRSFFFDYMIRDRGSVYPRTLTNYTDAIRNLRRFPETLKEAVDYPPAFYGYWITNSGEILPVNDGHEVSAELYMNRLGMDSSIFNILKMTATRYAIEGLGWVRIVTEQHGIVYIDFMSETINHKVVLVLIDFLQTYNKDNRVFQYKIDVTEGMSFDEGKTDHADFDNLRQTIAFLRSTGTKVTEDRVPQSNYGYWVTHTGDILPVPRLTTHNDIAEKYIRDNSLDHSEYWQQPQPAMTYAIREMGWARVISYKYLDIHYSTRLISDRTISSLVRVIRSLDKDMNFQQVYINTDSHPHGFGVFDNAIDAIRIIRSKSAPIVFESAIPSTVYGYWIDHTGKFYPTDKAGEHPYKAMEVFKMYGHPFDPHKQDAYQEAFKLGWVRVVLDMWLEFEFHKDFVNKVALKSAYNLAIQSKRNTNYLKIVSDEEKFPEPIQLNHAGMIVMLEKYLGINTTTGKKYEHKPRSLLQRLMKRKPVKEANIPYSDYGYWVDEDGKVYRVGSGTGHMDSLYQHFPRKYNISQDEWDEITINHPYLFEVAYEKGWARVISNNTSGMGIKVWASRVTPKTWNTLFQLTKITNYTKYFMDTEDNNSVTFDHREGDPKRKMLQVLGRYRRGTPITEARDIPKTDYGYWISAEGEYIPVQHQGHSAFAYQYLKDRDFGKNVGRISYKNYAPSIVLYKEGWIRIVDGVSRLNVQMANPTKKAKDALIYLINNTYHHSYFLDYRNYGDMSGSESVSYDNVRDVISFVRKRPIKIKEAMNTSCEESFWISPNADFLDVGLRSHEKFIDNYFRMKGYTSDKWTYPSAQATAFSLGWLRGCFRSVQDDDSTRKMSVAIEVYKPSKQNLLKAIDMIRKRKDVELYYINDEYFDNRNEAFKYLRHLLAIQGELSTMDYMQALRHLTDLGESKKPAVKEAIIPDISYGMWIDDQGGYHAIDYRGHGAMAKEVLEKKYNINVEEYVQRTGNLMIEDILMERGWIRVVGRGPEGGTGFNVEVDQSNVTKDALRTLLEIVRKIGDEFETFVISDCVTSNYWSSANMLRFIMYLRTLMGGGMIESLVLLNNPSDTVGNKNGQISA